jgi:hypothetical protein
METTAQARIALTVPEIRKLLCRLVWRHLPDMVPVIHWSLWRRHHQAEGIIKPSHISIIACAEQLRLNLQL